MENEHQTRLVWIADLLPTSTLTLRRRLGQLSLLASDALPWYASATLKIREAIHLLMERSPRVPPVALDADAGAAFQFEDLRFHFDAVAIAVQRTVGCHDAMAWKKQRERVVGHHLSDGAGCLRLS